MDKFTVDLDQVLNDFEFSELTDQYNSSKITDFPNVHTQDGNKHTVNNVFHSLQEYINTNINSLESSDNNADENCTANLSISTKEEKSITDETKTDSLTVLEINQIQDLVEERSTLDKSICKEELNKPNKENSSSQLVVSEVLLPINDIEHDQLSSQLLRNESLNFEDVPDILKIEHCLEHPTETERLELEYTSDSNKFKCVSAQNHIDLHTELQNVVGNDFSIISEQSMKKTLSDVNELKTVIGFEQDIYLDDQEMTRLLSELEEDDELAVVEKIESQMVSITNNKGCKASEMYNENFSSFGKLIWTFKNI